MISLLRVPTNRTAAVWARRRPRTAVALGLALVTVALYAPSLGNGLTNWDDPMYVVANPFAAQGLAGIPQAIASPFDGAWYPLTQTVYCLVHAAAGASPRAHHLAQFVLFAATVALVPSALAAFGVPLAPAAAAALLWAAHPFRVESVAWAANLKDALMALGVVGAFATWRRPTAAAERCGRGGDGGGVVSAAAFLAAMLGKSMAFPVALVFPLLAWAEGTPLLRALRRTLVYTVPALAMAGIAAAMHFGIPSSSLRAHPGGSFVGAIPSALWLPWWYLGRTVLPLHPRAIYDFEPVGWIDARLAIALALWGATAAWVLTRPAAHRRWWCVGVAGWVLPFASVVGLAPLSFFVAERYTLLPSLALCAGVALAGGAAIVKRAAAAGAARAAAATGLAAAVALLAAGTLRREPDWRNGIALWESNRALAPQAFVVHYDLAGAYGGAARWEDALRELREARRIDPRAPHVLGDLLFAHAAKTPLPVTQLEAWTRDLVAANDSDAAVASVAVQVVEAGQPAVAHAWLDEAGRDGAAAVVGARSKIALAEGRASEAFELARRAKRMDPSLASAHVDELLALAALGRYEAVLQLSEQPMRERALERVRREVRALALEQLGRPPEPEPVADGGQ